MVELERQYIYETNNGNKFLCLSYHNKMGAQVCFVENKADSNNDRYIIGISKNEDSKLGKLHFDIFTAEHKSLKWIENFNPKKIGKMEISYYRAIVRRISYYMLGIIDVDDDFKVWYDNNKEKEVFDWKESVPEEYNLETEEIKRIFRNQSESSNASYNDILYENIEDDLYKPRLEAYNKLLENYSGIKQPKVKVEFDPDWELDNMYFNLLDAYNKRMEEDKHMTPDQVQTLKAIVQNRTGKIKKSIKGDERWIFSKREVIAIATMTISAVKDLYGVSSYIAQKYIYAAKYILGLDTNKSFNNIFCSYFNQGMTVDWVKEKYEGKVKGNVIDIAYENWLTNRFSDAECESAIERWRVPVDMNETELAKYIYNTSITKFSENERCRYHYSKEIISEIKTKQLAKNPYAIVGFNDLAFDEDKFKLFRASLSRIHMPCRCDEWILYNIDCLKDIYISTFDYHSKILAEKIEIPAVIPNELKDSFIWLLKARFSMDTLSKLSDEDKEYILYESIENIARKYMWRYNKIRSIISTLRKQNS